MRLPTLAALLLCPLLLVACAQAAPSGPLASAASSVAAAAADAKATLCASSGPDSLTQLATDLDQLGSGSGDPALRQDLATRIGAIAGRLQGLEVSADATSLRDQVSASLSTLSTSVATASPDPATVAQAAQAVRQLQQKLCV